MSDPFAKLYTLRQSSAWVVKAATALGAANDGVRRAFSFVPDDQALGFIRSLIEQQAAAGGVVEPMHE